MGDDGRGGNGDSARATGPMSIGPAEKATEGEFAGRLAPAAPSPWLRGGDLQRQRTSGSGVGPVAQVVPQTRLAQGRPPARPLEQRRASIGEPKPEKSLSLGMNSRVASIKAKLAERRAREVASQSHSDSNVDQANTTDGPHQAVETPRPSQTLEANGQATRVLDRIQPPAKYRNEVWFRPS